ncbi:hypothetical protein [Cecembia lonarensis]|uniref:Uncharacterized protein n=1 Tax=Cecembia lonarensis (strain CCUG 58316 / KCTC 22772 / LW9) TaxID=1225176 RepID=K1LA57_CECL9|nr:hypothetical protein [Cecembia lonarensis]EKB49142.1 hypothetical protein B879_02240 [Cecembia lonarensis LW9]
MKIHVLHYQSKFSLGFDDFYPLYKNKNLIKQKGYKINLFYNIHSPKIFDCDLIIVHVRYTFKNGKQKERFFNDLKDRKIIIVLFDGFDTSGIPNFEDYIYLDKVWKKQIFKDKSFYLTATNDTAVRPWLNNQEPLLYEKYQKATHQDLEKLLIGWNIGLCSYINFNYGFLNRFKNFHNYKVLKEFNFNLIKRYSFSFRGEKNYSNNKISSQRNKLYDILTTIDLEESIIGGKVSKSEYLRELELSKISVSPFGWGEICHRDFESMYSQAILFKPDVSHLETFPNFFINNETYIPLRWDLSDTEQKISTCLKDYECYQDIIKNAYDTFKMYHYDDLLFVNHFIKLIDLSANKK